MVLPGATASMPAADATDLRVVRRLAGGDRLHTVVELRRSEILVEVAGVLQLLDVLEPVSAAGVVAYLALPAVYCSAKSGTAASTLA